MSSSSSPMAESQYEVERALRAVNERLEALIEASPLAITVLAEDGTVRLWNPAAERIFGWSRREVLGAPAPWVESDERPEILTNIQASLHGKPLRGVEALRRRKSGDLIHISI